jgi:hypothetical protein
MPSSSRAACALFCLAAISVIANDARADEDDDERGLCANRCGFKVRSGDDSVIGLRGAITDVKDSGADDNAIGVMFAGRGESYASQGVASGRATHFFAIGGGNGGFEGALDLGVSLGLRVPITEEFGPFLRIGARGWLMGNDVLYSSLLELPLGEAGLQIASGRRLLEIAGRGGPVLTGRYNPGDGGERALGGSFEYGGHFAVQFDPVRVHGAFRRVDARKTGDDQPVDFWTGDLCLQHTIALCGDIQYTTGDAAYLGAFHHAKSTYGGVLLGFTID